MNVLFTYLVGFSGNGGIERFNRCFMKALHETHLSDLAVISVYDRSADENYITSDKFRAFNKNKLRYLFYTLFRCYRYDTIIIGHINLSVVGILIKILFPKKKLILIAHGIEVWKDLSNLEQKFLMMSDQIYAVSDFTRQILIGKHNLNGQKIFIFPNTIDPNFQLPAKFEKPSYLLEKYGISTHTKIVLTVSRMSRSDKFKGYEQVISALALVSSHLPYKYLLVGKYDAEVYQDMYALVTRLGLQEKVIFAGYVGDSELISYYLAADLFVMPSKKEGFGIVFIEAAACGLHVIAGNKDGSVEALDGGNFGTLIDPDNVEDIATSISNGLAISMSLEDKKALQHNVVHKYGFEAYKNRLKTYLHVS